jgi:hypothetical protein
VGKGTRCYRPNTQRLTQTGCILAKVVPSTERFRCPTPWWCARTRRNFPKGVQKARRKMSADPSLDRPRRRKYQLLLTASQARRQHRGGSFVDRLSAGAEAAESRSLSKGSQAAEAGRPRFQVSRLVTSGDSGYAYKPAPAEADRQPCARSRPVSAVMADHRFLRFRPGQAAFRVIDVRPPSRLCTRTMSPMANSGVARLTTGIETKAAIKSPAR